MGSIGSGKSYTANKLYPEMIRIDSDAIKKTHPEYHDKNSCRVHEWSLIKLEEEFQKAILHDQSFILDGTGYNANLMVRRITEAKMQGFTTILLYVIASLKTCLLRNAQRERVVPENVVKQKYKDVIYSFELVSPHVDQVQIINNDDDD